MNQPAKVRGLHRLLVVGVGSIGERHVRCFLKTGRAAVSICEVNGSLRDAVANRYGVVRATGNLEESLNDSFDAAVVAVPANLHVAIATRLLKAGVHVLIEKPLAIELDGVDELLRAAEEKRRVAAVGYVYRAHPSLAAMREAITSGSLGKPLQLVAVAGQHFPTFRPAYRETYYASRETGGGAIQDALTHVLNAGEWLVGPIDRLVADADHKRLEGVLVEDVAHVLARHGSVLASYALNQFQSPNEVSITVVCEKATARFEVHRHRWRQLFEPDSAWRDSPAPPIDRDTLFISQANAFLDSIDRQAPPLCSLGEGVQSLRVNRAALESLNSLHWQTVGRH